MNFTKDNLITIDKNKVPEDTLVIKINDMYFPLMNFNTPAPAPTPETTGAEYFKCAAVGTAGNGGSEDSGTTSASTDIIVSGAGSGHINGTYTLIDIVIDKDYLSEGQKKVYSYYWADLDQTLYIYYDWNTETWWISDDYNNHDIPFYGSSNAGSENPWEGGTWETGDATDPAPTVTQETTSGSGSGSSANMNVFLVKGIDVSDSEDYGSSELNGLYTIEDESATGTSRVWINSIDARIWSENDTDTGAAKWYITHGDYNNEDNAPLFSSDGEYESPWDVTTWKSYASSTGVKGNPVFSEAKVDIIVTGSDMDEANGNYVLLDDTQIGKDRRWMKIDDSEIEIWYDGSYWNIGHDGAYTIAYARSDADDPVSATTWEGDEEGYGSTVAPTLSWAAPEETPETPDIEPEKVWIGYKAILKEETEIIEIPGIASVVVSGCTYDTDFNGTYILVDESATGTNRVWKNEKNKYLAFNPGGENWCLYAELDGLFFYNNWYPDYPNYTIPENPWDAEHWENINGGNDVPVLTVNETPGTTETKTVKYYEFEETLTTDLTYGYGFTPVVGKVYDREAMVEATLFEKYVSPISSPENMTDFENDEWLISSTSVYDNRAAWQVFDGNVDTSCWLATSSPKDITWKNKKGKVLVKQIQGYFHDNQVWRNGSFVQGSNDGETWTDLFRGDFWNYFTYEDGKYKLVLTFPDNATSYQYHRIGTEYGSGSYGIIYELSAKSVID